MNLETKLFYFDEVSYALNGDVYFSNCVLKKNLGPYVAGELIRLTVLASAPRDTLLMYYNDYNGRPSYTHQLEESL